MSRLLQILREHAGKALNIPDGELDGLFNKPEEELDPATIVKALNDKYLANVNAFGKTRSDDGIAQGIRRKGEEYEKAIKKRFGVTSDKVGDELIEEVFAFASKDKGGSKGKMTDDEIRLSQPFLDMEKALTTETKKLKADHEKAITDLQAGYKKKETFASVSKSINDLWDSEGYIFGESENPKLIANRRNALLKEFSSYDWEQNGDEFIPIKDGKRLEDDLHHPISFKDLVSNVTGEFYEKKVTDKRQSPGDANKGDDSNKNQQKAYNGKLPTTREEFDKLNSDPKTTLAQKKELLNHWTEFQKKTA